MSKKADPPTRKPRRNPFPETIGGNPTPTSLYGDDPELEPPLPKMRDVHGRMVSTKPANQPYLAYGRWKNAQEEKEAKKKAKEEKKSRGEPVSDSESEVASSENNLTALSIIRKALQAIVLLIAIVALSGNFFTGSPTWGYEGKWTNIKTYWPDRQQLFSERTLAQFDGTDPTKPLYLAIDGDVFDVSSNRRTYGPGGSYHLMAGKDAARSFGTGCFKDHQTHDLRGLSEREMDGVKHWKQFFAKHKEYSRVGKVIHPPIDPLSPIPIHCDAKKEEDSKARQAEANAAKKEEAAKGKGDEL